MSIRAFAIGAALAALAALAAAPGLAQDAPDAPLAEPAPELPAGIAAPPATGAGEVPPLARALVAYSARDYGQARAAALAAAGQGDPEAMVLAGMMLERGQGGAADPARAREWYETAMSQDQADAAMALARMALDYRAGLAPPDARTYLRRATELGAPDAELTLAKMLVEGVGGPPDPARALEMLERLSADGSAAAQRELAWLVLEEDALGAGARARDLLEKAAASGDAEAAYEAGMLWTDSAETEDGAMARAAQLFAQSASGGHAAGATLYGHALWQGAGVAQDRDAAVIWYRRAAERGDGEGAFYYAVMLFAGAGLEADAEAAYYWALRSVAADPEAEAGYGGQRQGLIGQAEGRIIPSRAAELRSAAETGAPFPD